MFFSQRVTVPSLTLSPSAGMVITVPEVVGATATGGATGSGTATATGGATGAATGAATGCAGACEAPLSITASSAPTGTV